MILKLVQLNQVCKNITVQCVLPDTNISNEILLFHVRVKVIKLRLLFYYRKNTHFTTVFSSVAQVLHCCVSGSNLHTQQSHYLLTLSDLSSDYDLMLGQVKSFDPPSQLNTADFGNLLTVAEGKIFKSAQSEFN